MTSLYRSFFVVRCSFGFMTCPFSLHRCEERRQNFHLPADDPGAGDSHARLCQDRGSSLRCGRSKPWRGKQLFGGAAPHPPFRRVRREAGRAEKIGADQKMGGNKTNALFPSRLLHHGMSSCALHRCWGLVFVVGEQHSCGHPCC